MYTHCQFHSLLKSVMLKYSYFVQYGAEEKGVIYPGDVEVTVDLDPEVVGCSDATVDDTSCIATITNNANYTVSLTVINDLNSATLQKTFDCKLHLHVATM